MLHKHKYAIDSIPIEALVSFALGGSMSQILPFLQSYEDLADTVKACQHHPVLSFAWKYAARVYISRKSVLRSVLTNCTGREGHRFLRASALTAPPSNKRGPGARLEELRPSIHTRAG